jgi:hypothetical protein
MNMVPPLRKQKRGWEGARHGGVRGCSASRLTKEKSGEERSRRGGVRGRNTCRLQTTRILIRTGSSRQTRRRGVSVSEEKHGRVDTAEEEVEQDAGGGGDGGWRSSVSA